MKPLAPAAMHLLNLELSEILPLVAAGDYRNRRLTCSLPTASSPSCCAALIVGIVFFCRDIVEVAARFLYFGGIVAINVEFFPDVLP